MKSSIIRKAFIISGLFMVIQYLVFKMTQPVMIKPQLAYLFIGINFGICIGISMVAFLSRLNSSPTK
jgi:hypothetical protein